MRSDRLSYFSNSLPCGAPVNVVIGTNVSPSGPIGNGAGNEFVIMNVIGQ